MTGADGAFLKVPDSVSDRPVASWFRKTGIVFLSRVGLWTVLVGLALAWLGMLFRFSPWGGGMGENSPRVWTSILAWACTAGILIAALAWLARRVRPGCFLAVCLGLELAGQAAVVLLANPAWHPTNDAAIFSGYLDHLAENGTGKESLSALSTQYDYRVWTRRAHPFFLPLRKAFETGFPAAVAWLQVALSLLTTAFAWRTVRVCFGCKTACWATIFRLAFPFRWIACLELNHHLFGGLYFTVALWTLVEFFRVPHGRAARWGLCGIACILLPLMKLEGGIDWVYCVSVWVVVAGLFLAGRLGTGRALASMAGLWLLPLVVSHACVSPLLARIDAADLHHLESGAVAFMARGWVPETGGEYAHSHEIIDTLTPLPLKTGVQTRLLLSQLAYNGPTVCFRLFPTKLAKYFLLGFASGAEEMLNANNARAWATLAKGARIAFFFFFAPLAMLGGAWWLSRTGKSRDWPFWAPCILLVAAYVCTGETSPRYSIYIQTALFAFAGLAVSRARTRRFFPSTWPRDALPPAAILAGGYLAVASLAVLFLPPRLVPLSCLDARAWPGEGSIFVRPSIPEKAPFAVNLTPRAASGGTIWGPLALPAARDGHPDLIVYAFPGSNGTPLKWHDTQLSLDTGKGPSFLQSLRLPACIRLPGAGTSGGLVVFRAPFACDAPIALGYAFGTESEDADNSGTVRRKERHEN